MKKCPNCNKVYRDFDQYCLVCRYKLKYIDGTEKVDFVPPQHEPSYAPKSKPTVECTYCKSTNVKKITTTRKFFSTGFLGLASNTIGKSWHCNSCGSDF